MIVYEALESPIHMTVLSSLLISRALFSVCVNQVMSILGYKKPRACETVHTILLNSKFSINVYIQKQLSGHLGHPGLAAGSLC